MRKDPTEFRERFAKWKVGEQVYENGLPKYKNGKKGYTSSQRIRSQISKWEGAAMNRVTIDPLSGKPVGPNRSFDEVDRAFYGALPQDIRDAVLSNQNLADSLYSYAYNVGTGKFAERVVPALRNYYGGNGSVADIQASMWAHGDKKLKGLANRRMQERAMVEKALSDQFPTASRAPYANDDYNYYRANMLDYQPDETGHMPSRDYKSGLYLKSATHQSVMKSIVGDLAEGYQPYYDKKTGRLASQTIFKMPTIKEVVEDQLFQGLPAYGGGKSAKKGSYYLPGEKIRRELDVPYDNSSYDYRRANQLGYEPDKTGHLPSRDWITGRYLKAPTHPTESLSIYTDLGLGYDVFDKYGNTYSQPNWGSTWKVRLPGYEIGKPGWDDTEQQKAVQEWGSDWKTRTTAAGGSKVVQKWNATGKKPKPESSEQYTKRRVAEETKRTWLSDAADVAEGVKEGALAMNPYTAASYFGAKVGQDVLNGNVDAYTALNAAFATMPFMPRFTLPKLPKKSAESIDFNKLREKAAKLKADDDAWRAAHPEMELDVFLKRPKLPNAYENIPTELIRDVDYDSRNISERILKWIEQRGLLHLRYPTTVQNVYETQIIPRRAKAFADAQQTSGVYKIQKYLKDQWMDDVDFSTKEGLQIASDNGWTFEEMADWSNYKQYIQKLKQYSNGDWTEYSDDAWEKIYPIVNGKQTVGDYIPKTNKIRVKKGYDALLHESRHRMDNYIPLTKQERNALREAYDFLDHSDPENISILNDELVTTNSELRDLLLSRNYANNKSLSTQQKILNDETWIADEDLLQSLRNINSYGRKIVEGIERKLDRAKKSWSKLGWNDSVLEQRLAEEKKKYISNIRYALSYVGGSAAAVTIANKQNTQNELRNK